MELAVEVWVSIQSPVICDSMKSEYQLRWYLISSPSTVFPRTHSTDTPDTADTPESEVLFCLWERLQLTGDMYG
jgi:hypothetical protein